jgi:hypothetical protein
MSSESKQQDSLGILRPLECMLAKQKKNKLKNLTIKKDISCKEHGINVIQSFFPLFFKEKGRLNSTRVGFNCAAECVSNSNLSWKF